MSAVNPNTIRTEQDKTEMYLFRRLHKSNRLTKLTSKVSVVSLSRKFIAQYWLIPGTILSLIYVSKSTSFTTELNQTSSIINENA